MTEIRGMIQSASALTGTLSNQGSITGDIAGLRGLKGDKGDPGEKGDTGDTGATGNGISSAILNSDYTLTLNFTDGTSYTTTAIRGEKGDTGDTGLKGDTGATGNGIASIAKTGTQGLVDTYTITFTDGTTSTFTVTNGQNGSGSVADVWVNNVSVLDGDTAKVTVPTKVSDLTNDSGFITTETDPTVSAWAKQSTKPSYSYSEISGTPTLADVATTGDYDDLINTPNVATVVELTQAQYDALTPAEKNNGNVYCVSDASGTYLTASEVSYGSSSVQDALDTEVGRTDALVEQIRNIRSVSRGRVEGGTHTFTLDEFATYLIIMQTSSSEGYVAYILSRYSTYSHLHKLYNGSYVNDVTSYADGVLTITLTYPATVSIVKM